MTRTAPTEDEALALCYPCSFCGAKAEAWCVTVNPTSRPAGQWATWLHSARTWPLNESWRLGWRAGRSGALHSAAWHLENARQNAAYAEREGIPVLAPTAGAIVEAWLKRQAEEAW